MALAAMNQVLVLATYLDYKTAAKDRMKSMRDKAVEYVNMGHTHHNTWILVQRECKIRISKKSINQWIAYSKLTKSVKHPEPNA